MPGDVDAHAKASPEGLYDGQVKDGKKNGVGKFIHENYSYEGQWLNDVREGKGRLTYSDGRVYDGQFKEGKKHGLGKSIAVNGTVYEGNWGTIYHGEWVDDLKHGKGVATYADGSTFVGKFAQGYRLPGGKFTRTDGTVVEGTAGEIAARAAAK
eukprot:gene18979-21589_t